MFIRDPDFYPSRVPDPKKQQKRREKKFVVLPFLATNITKLNWRRKKLEPISKNIELFTQKIVTKLSKIWYGIRVPEKTYFGTRGQKGTGSRIQIRNTALNKYEISSEKKEV